MTRYLASATKSALIADLASFGFVFKDENGATRPPKPMEVIHHEGNDCIYLGHIPAQYDAEDNITKPASTDFCANVTACNGYVFAKEITEPETPYNKFAT